MEDRKINEVIEDDFALLDPVTNLPVSGVPPAAFIVQLFDPDGNEVHGTVPVTIVELGGGNYRASFTPNKLGVWLLVVIHLTYCPWGQRNDYKVYTQDFDDIGPGTGDHMVTVTVQDSVTLNPITGVRVQVYNEALTTRVAQGYTDAGGQIVLNLDDGTYKVYLKKLGAYTFTTPETLVVSGPGAVTYQGDAFTPPVPSSPETCMVYGWLTDQSGAPLAAEVTAELVEQKAFTDAGVQVVRRATTTTSRANDGYWELELTRSAQFTDGQKKYSFLVDEVAMCEFIVPDQASVNFATLTENQPV